MQSINKHIRLWGFVFLCSAFQTAAVEIEFSANLREKLTHFSAVEFQASHPEAGTFWTQRLNLASTTQFSEGWRVQASIESALQEGVAVTPIERNNLDLFELYGAYQGANIA